jgi:archaellum biogenesis protein FlaJ (TadC family)
MVRSKPSIVQSWHEQAEAVRANAEKLPHGKERELLERKARQLETASEINRWLTSSGLTAPR